MFEMTEPSKPRSLRNVSRMPERMMSRLMCEAISREEQLRTVEAKAFRNILKNRNTASNGSGSWGD